MFAFSLSLSSTSRTHRSASERPAVVSSATRIFSLPLEHCHGFGGGSPGVPEWKLPSTIKFFCSCTTTPAQAIEAIIRPVKHIAGLITFILPWSAAVEPKEFPNHLLTIPIATPLPNPVTATFGPAARVVPVLPGKVIPHPW